jgi:prepilin-type N-terminal cleavage/methylation domain-containing protein
MNTQAGLTLLEIAVVLVIIGLLLGGVLKGQEIIINAKIKNLENNYKGISIAIYSYQDRYRALPGDDKDATKQFKVNSPTIPIIDGDNNGKISGEFDDTSETPDNTKESRHLWAHLRLAHLIKGVPGTTALPLHPFNGVMGVASPTQFLRGRMPITLTRTFIGFTNIPNKIALILESRHDDLNPHIGQIQTQEMSYTNPQIQHKIYFAL